ncbi:MAG: biotin--[acetyl-CoA-carboxylase] ligase [Phycisphaeraceae bacterium]|nr:biotin--[acetyl-CoA-carboxylase] ligase [Phycisphaeraceae bacterium]MCB9847961.1 biotin--[acetyl-CoA-carboxylase] ligase [Phycisphaeraceae bacterium]
MTTTENQNPVGVEWFDVVDSTSALARRLVGFGGFGDRPRLLGAGRQTGGVGRFRRAWASPLGGLWMTLGWPVSAGSAPGIVEGLGLRVGLAMHRAIDETLSQHGAGDAARIKWPNDILVDGRKVAGALCEVIPRGEMVFILAGVGVNGNFPRSELPEQLQHTATTLLEIAGAPVDLDRLRNSLTDGLRGAMLTTGIDEAALTAIGRVLHGVGAPIVVTMPSTQRVEGRLLGLTGDGRLRLGAGAGEVVLPSGVELASVNSC